jgi:hypothetical protein
VAEVVENWDLDTDVLALLVCLDIVQGVPTCFLHGTDPLERAMAFCPGAWTIAIGDELSCGSTDKPTLRC